MFSYTSFLRSTVVIFFFLLGFQSIGQIPLDSLKAHYSFDGSLLDNSSNSNHIVAGNGTYETDRFGNSSKAFHFDGINDSLTLPLTSFAPISGDFTISFWYKTRSPQVMNLLSIKDSPTDTIQNFEVQVNSHNAYYLEIYKQIWYSTFVYWNGTGQSLNAIAEGGPGEFTKGEWCHFLIERSSDTFKIYRNHVLYTLSIDNYFSGNLGDLSPLIFGAAPYRFEGDLDDLRFYTKALSENEIYRLYMENKAFEFISPKKTDAYVQGSSVLVNWEFNTDLISDSIRVEYRINSGPWIPAIHSNLYYENYSYLDMNLPFESIVEMRVSDFFDSTLTLSTGPIEVSLYKFVEVSNALPFTNRDGAGLLNFKGKMWLLGGWDPPYHPPNSTVNEVWNSTDGINWTQLPNAPWPARHCSAWLVKDSAMWVIGGDPQSGCLRDVWKSEDGITWIQTVDTIPFFDQRNNPNYGVLNDKLLIYGGEQCGAGPLNDVWESVDGINWTQLPDAPWKGRGMQINSCVDDENNLWMLGGSNEGDRRSYNDVWKTSDGINWVEVMKSAPWNAKHWHTTAFFDNKIWVMAGMNTAYEANDFWYSENGVDWRQLKTTIGVWPVGTRHAQSSTVYDNALWYMCGISTNNAWKIVNSSQTNTIKEKEVGWSVFPNPNSSTFSFTLEEKYTNLSYEITNQMGEIQKSGIVKSGKNEVRMNDLPNGIYFMKINAENLSIQKIIKL